ncbi:hypothetical protein D041_4111B, partial [Vibrio parahaemolyticus EKP-008]
ASAMCLNLNIERPFPLFMTV